MAQYQPPAKRGKTLFSLFNKREDQIYNQSTMDTPSTSNAKTLVTGVEPHLTPQVAEQRDFNMNSIERDQRLRCKFGNTLLIKMRLEEHIISR